MGAGRRRALAIALAVGVAGAAAGAAALLTRRPPERVLYRGGAILTLDEANRVVEALAVEGDRIVAAGSEAELADFADGATRVVDLGGHALLPGFIDAHGHFPGAGIYAVAADLNSPPIGTVRDLAELRAALAAMAQRTDPGDWIVGMGYDDTLLAERRHPTRADLDAVSTEHPIAAFHISGHLAVANTPALALLGIDAKTGDPAGGRIRRDPRTGEPDGVLEETAMEPLEKRILDPSLPDAWRIVQEATDRYLRAGVTTAQTGYAPRGQIVGLAWLSRLHLLPLRLVVWPDAEATDAMLDGDFSPPGNTDRFRVGAVKLVADGSIQGYTAYLSQPYHVPPGGDPDYRGYPRIPRRELFERVLRYHAAGLQVAVHGNGDAAIDDIVDAFEYAQRKHPRQDARPVVVHAQMARDDQLERMHKLSIIPSFFTLHTYYWGDRHRDIFLGPERAARISPARTAQRRGVRFTIHCDAPVVPMEPLRLVWSAVNRLSTSGAVIGPRERITPLEALRAVTIDAAFQHFEEDLVGSLEPGKRADLVILSRSPLDDPEHIDEIEVLETIIGGRTAWRAE